jgi:hypothetical protein
MECWMKSVSAIRKWDHSGKTFKPVAVLSLPAPLPSNSSKVNGKCPGTRTAQVWVAAEQLFLAGRAEVPGAPLSLQPSAGTQTPHAHSKPGARSQGSAAAGGPPVPGPSRVGPGMGSSPVCLTSAAL